MHHKILAVRSSSAIIATITIAIIAAVIVAIIVAIIAAITVAIFTNSSAFCL